MPTKKTFTTFRDHCQRTSSLLDHAASQMRQSVLLLNTIAVNYPTLCRKWLQWGGQLVSLSHQMEELSLSLATMGQTGLSVMGEKPISLSEAYEIYLALSEVKND